MTLLIVVISLLLGISFTCSILESIILSVTEPFIQTLIDRKRKSGNLLQRFKKHIDEPISAILTLNTIANTAGAAFAGALALRIFGSSWMAVFSGILTLLILIFSEIIPKTIGASYWKVLSPLAAWVLWVIIIVTKPVAIPLHLISKLIVGKKISSKVTKEELINTIRFGHLEGIIESDEFKIVENLFKLKVILVKDIMTPRMVVVWLRPEQTPGSLITDRRYLQFSRLPLYNQAENRVEGIVLRRDILDHIINNKVDVSLSEFAKKPQFVPDTLSIFKLLDKMITRNAHLAVVINEFGDYVGVVTMEDAIETLLGREIVDESDRVVDMRALARERMQQRFKDRGISLY